MREPEKPGTEAHFRRGRYIALDAGYGDSAWDYSRLDIRGDLENIPLLHDSVDCILCMVVLEHTQNPRQVIREFARILKPEGTLVMVVPFLWEEHQAPHDYFRFTRYGVHCLFESSSLRLGSGKPDRRLLLGMCPPFGWSPEFLSGRMALDSVWAFGAIFRFACSP